MNIVTGYTGTPHVTANEAQALNQGIFGPENYVLDVGQKFSATLVDANNITIEDGEGVLQGVQFRIAPGETENVSIDSGTTGYNRIDLICARYTKDAQTGVEAVNLVVIKGTPTSSAPTEPSYNSGDVLMGDSPVDFPLYKVTLTGVTPVVTQMFDDRILYASHGETIVTTETKSGSGIYHAVSEFEFNLKPGTYMIITHWQTSANSAITYKESYAEIEGNNRAYQIITGTDVKSIVNSVDIVTVTADTTALANCEVRSGNGVSIIFSGWVKAVRI
jgi:hypothetical protein